jgi:hypothetical protein
MFRSTRTVAVVASKRSMLVLMIVLLLTIVQPCQAGTFFDDFNDGNADGWWLGYSHTARWIWGNWRVENGTLAQDEGHDFVIALVENLSISGQSTEVQTKVNGPSGGTGIVIWYHDVDNYILVDLVPVHGYIAMGEIIDNVETDMVPFPYNTLLHDTWYTLKVDADSTTGELRVSLDGEYLFTFYSTTPHRLGLSGVVTGNAGGYFDNFRLTLDDIPIAVAINIRPEGDANRINLRSNGKVAVAILSTPDFDAPSQIDQNSLTFGATGDEQSLISCKRKPKDVDHDGVKDDLVCLFYVQLAGFKCGDTEGILKGLTKDGKLIEGKDLVNIVKCK